MIRKSDLQNNSHVALSSKEGEETPFLFLCVQHSVLSKSDL